MKLLPFDSFEVETSLTVAQLNAGLRARLETPRLLWLTPDHKPFQGRVRPDGFKASRILQHRNTAYPVAVARYAPTTQGTRVHILLRPLLLGAIGAGIWLLVLAGASVAMAWELATGAREWSAGLFVLPVMSVLAWVVATYTFWRAAKSGRQEYTDLLRGIERDEHGAAASEGSVAAGSGEAGASAAGEAGASAARAADAPDGRGSARQGAQIARRGAPGERPMADKRKKPDQKPLILVVGALITVAVVGLVISLHSSKQAEDALAVFPYDRITSVAMAADRFSNPSSESRDPAVIAAFLKAFKSRQGGQRVGRREELGKLRLIATAEDGQMIVLGCHKLKDDPKHLYFDITANGDLLRDEFRSAWFGPVLESLGAEFR